MIIGSMVWATLSPAWAQNAPEISTSGGVPGGIVLFWPRVVPRTQDATLRALAGALQVQMRAMVERAAPGRTVDVRPEPQRVCGQAGCKAMTVGVLLYHQGEACLAVGLVSGPGKAEARLVPWVGDVAPKTETVPFREPPESALSVHDWARCDTMLAGLEVRQGDVEAAITAVASPN